MVLTLVLALMPGAAVGAASAGASPILLNTSTLTMHNVQMMGIIPSPQLSPTVIVKILNLDVKAAEHNRTGQELEQEVETENSNTASMEEQIAAINQRIADWTRQADAVKAQIDAHNNEPHTFQLPQQQAALEQYDAEATELGQQQSALTAEGNALDAQQSQLQGQAQQLATEEEQLSSQISAFETEAEQLAAERQQLLQEMMSALDAALQSEMQTSQPAQLESPSGGDQGSPADQDANAVPPQDDGGDSVSPSSDNAALDTYAKDNGVDVDRQPVRVLLTPSTVSRLPADQTEQLTPSWTYDALVPQPDGTYQALEIQPTGTALSPENQAFNNAISQGGQAMANVNGQPITVTKVQTVPETEPTRAPATPTAPTVDPLILEVIAQLDSGGQQGASVVLNDGPILAQMGATMLRPDRGHDPTGRAEPRPEPDKCTDNTPVYGPRAPAVYQGQHGDRASGAEACVVSTQSSNDRDDLDFPLFGYTKGTGMAHCHLIAHSLNGSDTDLDNFAPCYHLPTNLTWMYHRFERLIANQVDAAHNPVYMIVRPVYAGQTPIPLGFMVFAQGNKEWTCGGFIPNVTPQQEAAYGITPALEGC